MPTHLCTILEILLEGYIMRLTGWQRLWVLLSVLYLLPVVAITMAEIPTADKVKSRWAEMIRYTMREFGATNVDALSDEQAIALAPLAAAAALDKLPADQIGAYTTARSNNLVPAFPVDLLSGTTSSPTDLGSTSAPIADGSEAPGPREEYQREPDRSPAQGRKWSAMLLGTQEPEKAKLHNAMTKAETAGNIQDASILAKELRRLGSATDPAATEEFAQRIEELDREHQQQLVQLSGEQLRATGFAFAVWITPVLAIYMLGASIGWVYRGFRQ